MKKLSVIIPIFNGKAFISGCLRSVVEQTYKNWEVVVVEDGSSDGTEEIVEQFRKSCGENKFLYRRHQTNLGSGPAKNTAIETATGDYLAILDCDDFWKPEYLETMIRRLEESGADVAFSAVQCFDHLSGMPLRIWGPTEKELQTFRAALFKRCFITPSGTIIRKEAQKIVGLFDTDPLVHYCEDHDYWLRCVEKDLKFTFVKGTYCWYRKNCETQMTANFPRMLERDLRVLNKHKLSYAAPKSQILLAIWRKNLLLAIHRRINRPKKALRRLFGKLGGWGFSARSSTKLRDLLQF